MRAFGGFPPGGRRSFFKSLHRFGILLVGPRPGAHMREAQVLQGAVDRVVRHREPERLMQPHDQVARAPAYHTVDRRNRALINDPGEKGLVLLGSKNAPANLSASPSIAFNVARSSSSDCSIQRCRT